IAVCVALAVRSVSGWALTFGLAVAGAGVTTLCHGSSTNLGWFGLCVLAGWCALRNPLVQAVTLTAGILAVMIVQSFIVSDPGWAAWSAGTVFTIIVCVLTKRQSDLIGQLREAQDKLAERTRAEERNRIAGEM